MKKYHPKVLQLALLMGVNPNTIIMDPDTFDIQEIYCDETETMHFKVTLKSGVTIIEKTKKS